MKRFTKYPSNYVKADTEDLSGLSPISSLKSALRMFRSGGSWGGTGKWSITDRVKNKDSGEITFDISEGHYIVAGYYGGKLYNYYYSNPAHFEAVAKAVKSVFPNTRY
jgi:hypothetical protein